MKETGIHAIIQKINADADQHSNDRFMQIKSEADRDKDSKNAFYYDDLSKRRDMLKNHNKHKYALLLDRLRRRFNRELLTYRRNLINEIFDMAALKLRDSSGREFTDMFTAAVRGLTGDFTLYIGELSKGRLDAQAVENAIKENSGLCITLSSNTIAHKSGFLLKDDRVEYNCLFEDLIDNKKNEQATLILKEVFGDLLS